jgi:hypothetical protein
MEPKVIFYILLIVGYIIYNVYKVLRKRRIPRPPRDISSPDTPDLDEMIEKMKRIQREAKASMERSGAPKPPVQTPRVKPLVKTSVKPVTKTTAVPEHYKYAKEGMRPERMVTERMVREANVRDANSRSQEKTDQHSHRRMKDRDKVEVVDYDEMLIQKGSIKNKHTGETSDIHFQLFFPRRIIP